MFLIMSAGYIELELQSEFGKIPPSFLPLGNKRLFHHQSKLVSKSNAKYISIPESFDIRVADYNWLKSEGFNLIRTPDNLSLGASLVAALNLSGESLDSNLSVLFGDTLFQYVPVDDDIIGVSVGLDNYNWAELSYDDQNFLIRNRNDLSNDKTFIVNGYFNFSNPRHLIKSITKSNWDFIDGVNKYNKSLKMEAVHTSSWYDFGHVNTYYRSKANFTTQRAFNDLEVNDRFIEKSSHVVTKIKAEAHWFSKIPHNLRIYTPQLLGEGIKNNKPYYRLEYLHQTALNELYVFSKITFQSWTSILNECIGFIKDCKKNLAPPGSISSSINELFTDKTYFRLGEYALSNDISLDDKWFFNNHNPVTLREIVELSTKFLPNSGSRESTVLHGDFCFSNILYDFRSNRIKVIDPRGVTADGVITIYGDVLYDVAKLSHSIIGMYDFIIAGYYELETNGFEINFSIEIYDEHSLVQNLFYKLMLKEFGITKTQLLAMQIHLFISMLPLHKENNDRQRALLSNAMRLYQMLVKEIK